MSPIRYLVLLQWLAAEDLILIAVNAISMSALVTSTKAFSKNQTHPLCVLMFLERFLE